MVVNGNESDESRSDILARVSSAERSSRAWRNAMRACRWKDVGSKRTSDCNININALRHRRRRPGTKCVRPFRSGVHCRSLRVAGALAASGMKGTCPPHDRFGSTRMRRPWQRILLPRHGSAGASPRSDARWSPPANPILAGLASGPRVPHGDRRQAHALPPRRLQAAQGAAGPQGPGQRRDQAGHLRHRVQEADQQGRCVRVPGAGHFITMLVSCYLDALRSAVIARRRRPPPGLAAAR
ncbi:hypothetical protein ON010_g17286 [Phytophthora cinnamomi]|nr:hypothetical protein ON010_g17286 [Phytophthora cinnamomi]